MNKKILVFTFIILLSISNIYSNNAQIEIYNQTIMPKSTKIGYLQFANQDPLLIHTNQIFKEEYSPDWIENNVQKEFRYGFSKKYSKKLALLLPIKETIYFSLITYQENNISLSLELSSKEIIDIIYDKSLNQIISLNFR